MTRILVTDGMDREKYLELEDLGYEMIDEKVEVDELKERIKEVDCVIIRSRTKITKEIIDEAKKTGRLKLIIRAGVGLDNIDVAYAEAGGIKVCNTPTASSNAVAELALAQMINIARFVQTSNITMREGKWEKSKYKGFEIMGKTLGLIGCGRIGQCLGDKAKALGMEVIYYDVNNYKLDKFTRVDLGDLLNKSDFISIHMPGGKNNEHFISDEEFGQMKEGVYFIDLARGGIVNEEALLRAIDKGIVAGAALDVYEEEPTNNKALLDNRAISITPHIGASTEEAQARIGEEIVKLVRENL